VALDLAIFIFIAWVIISVYIFVPKRLSIIDNFLLFFLFTIITMNIFTILDLNINLFQHSQKVNLFISFWIHRNIIIPLSLVIFVNYMIYFKSKINKLVVSVMIFLILYLINLLAFGVGIMTCASRLYLGSGIVLAALMLLAFLTMKLVTKLPEGKSM
jgi:hypothetical protein